MSRFLDAVANDINKTFINVDEFGSTHTIGGVSVSCVIDDHMADDMRTTGGMMGVLPMSRTIYIKRDVIDMPVQGMLLTIDGERYSVQTVREDMGLLQIEVERYGN